MNAATSAARGIRRTCAIALVVAAATAALPFLGATPPAGAAEPRGVETVFFTSTSVITKVTPGPDGRLWWLNSSASELGATDTSGNSTNYSIPGLTTPTDMVAGDDNALWFTEKATGKIGRITTDGASVTEYPTSSNGTSPMGIAKGSDGRLWFTLNGTNKVGAITTAGVVTEYTPTAFVGTVEDIVAGPDGNLWVSTGGTDVLRFTTAGVSTKFTIASVTEHITSLAVGPDNNLWYASTLSASIGKFSTAGSLIQTYYLPTGAGPAQMIAGPDGNLWIPHWLEAKVMSVTTTGVVSTFPLSTPPNGTIAAGSDGNIWLAKGGALARVGTTPSPDGEFTALPPTRILDTRTTLGDHLGKLQPGVPIDVPIEGAGGVPATGVKAVVMNVTVTEPTNTSHMTVWPQGLTEPNISNLNFAPGQTIPNLVTVAINNGGVSIANLAGQTHLVIDVVGYYADSTGDFGGRYHAIGPIRYFDTRTGLGGVPASPLGADAVFSFKVTGKAGVPASGVTAVVMNVTVTQQTSAGHLTVYPSGGSTPTASNLNFVPGYDTPNLVIVKVPANGVVNFFDHLYPGQTVHLLADVVGYFDGDKSTEAGRLVTGQPARIADTRITSPSGSPACYGNGGGLGLNFPNADVGALVLNVTVTGAAAPGFVTAFPGDLPFGYAPNASNVNFLGGQTVPNHVVVRRGSNGLVIFLVVGGCTYLVIDAFGYFTSATARPPTGPVASAADAAQQELPELQPSELLEITRNGG